MIQIEEIIWVLVAIPGFVWWLRNRYEAGGDVKALQSRKIENGRMYWARFSVFLTTVMVGIEFVFILIGMIGMFRRPSPDVRTPVQIILVTGLVGSSVAISFLAKRWADVNSMLRGKAATQDASLRRRGKNRKQSD